MYEVPVAELVELESEDIILTSAPVTDTDDEEI